MTFFCQQTMEEKMQPCLSFPVSPFFKFLAGNYHFILCSIHNFPEEKKMLVTDPKCSFFLAFLYYYFQIAVTPTLFSTTPEARDRFDPKDRGCYVEGELPLKYLPSKFYRYEMSNCLFEAAYEQILEECKCMPRFGVINFFKLVGCK